MEQVETGPTERRLSVPLRLGAARWQLSARTVVAALAGLAALSIALRVYLAQEVHGPYLFMDELGYQRMASTFAHTGHFSLFGKGGLAYSPLYPIIVSPVYRLTSSAQSAYHWVQGLNAVLISLSVFPLYAVARSVLSRPRALGVAALSLTLPLMFYADLELSESLAYPLFLVAVWAMLRAVRSASVRNDLVLMGAILLASAARLQNVALFPAALTAMLVVPLVRPEQGATRLRATAAAARRHWPLFGSVLVLLGAVLVRRAVNGGALPLAGRYSNVGTAHASPWRVVELSFQHLAELDFALGVVPFAGALLAAYALVRFGFPARQLAFAAVAVACTFWLVLEVGFDAAAFDHPGSVLAAPRIHERYLVYLMPLFLVALVAALRAVRPRVGTAPHLAIAAVAALLPAAVPFSSVVNYTILVESFGLQIFGTSHHGELGPIGHAWQVAAAIGAVLVLGFLYAVVRPRPSFAIVVSVFALLILSQLVRVRLEATIQETYDAVPTHTPWVDRAANGADVALVGGPGTTSGALLLTAFDNLSITRVYSTCDSLFGADFGERRADRRADGTLVDGSTPVSARYAVVPARLAVRGRVLARQPKEGLVLVAPTGGVLRTGATLGCRR
jgi:hypothetical protein